MVSRDICSFCVLTRLCSLHPLTLAYIELLQATMEIHPVQMGPNSPTTQPRRAETLQMPKRVAMINRNPRSTNGPFGQACMYTSTGGTTSTITTLPPMAPRRMHPVPRLRMIPMGHTIPVTQQKCDGMTLTPSQSDLCPAQPSYQFQHYHHHQQLPPQVPCWLVHKAP